MTITSVGIFGRPADSHVQSVSDAVRRSGGSPTIVATDPASTERWHWSDTGIRTGEGIQLLDFGSAYIRTLGVAIPREPSSLDATRAASSRVKAAHAALCGGSRRIVNPVDAYWFHRSKPAADAAMAVAGLSVPDSLATADPAALFVFVQEHREVVYKPVAGGGACRALSQDDMTPERLGSLAESPVYFQERVRGDDLRVYVLDGVVVGAAQIVTDALDFRGNEQAVFSIVADDDLRHVAVEAARALGLVFSGVDVKRRDDGSLVVLDANPSPMFLGFEQRASIPVTAALASFLVSTPVP